MQEQHLENTGQVGVDTTELPVAQRQPVRILMTQTSRTINSSPSPQPSTLQNSVRPLGRTGFFSNGVPTNLEEIRPIIAQAYSVSTFVFFFYSILQVYSLQLYIILFSIRIQWR